MKDTRGITLIEIIMVISIFSIILLIPILKGNIIFNYKERKELKEFKNDLNYARNKAIIESSRYSVMLKPDDNYYIIFKHNPSREIVKSKEFINGIKINRTNMKFDEVIFNNSGSADKGGTIYLTNKKGKKITITVTPATGKVNIYFD